MPAARLVDRLDALRALARGRRVADLGFVAEGRLHAKRSRGSWLHAVLAEEAWELMGIDVDAEGVAHAVGLGLEPYQTVAQPLFHLRPSLADGILATARRP